MGRHQQCDGMARRDAIKIGMLGSAGITMSGFMRMADAGEIRQDAKAQSAIFVELPGGPSHLDTFDLKPEGPTEIRGSFKPINTNVPGIQISEHLPKLAGCADKYVIFRGVSHSLGAHPLGQRFLFTVIALIPRWNTPVSDRLFPKSWLALRTFRVLSRFQNRTRVQGIWV